MINTDLIMFSSDLSSTKLVKQGTGSVSVPALGGAGETYGIATIPHGYGSSELIFQVAATRDTGGTDVTLIAQLPWISPDGRIRQYAYVDETNLYVVCLSFDGSGSGAPARTMNFEYRLLIP